MANGFKGGYFGMQVHPTNRKVLFSIWSPFKTDIPSEVPEDKKVKLLRKGEGVLIKDFGGEGSGGQSKIIYPWVAETTYGFLTKAEPSSNFPGQTEYTAWFKTPEGWRLIASWLRPGGAQYLTGLYSFAENFLHY